MTITKIISGGQTGVDSGALDAALALSIPISGYCPKERLCETGKLPARFPLIELPVKSYKARTEKNVIESDGTLILNGNSNLQGGTLSTYLFAEQHRKPCLILRFQKTDPQELFNDWIEQNKIQILNIAGPRESKHPGIYQKTLKLVKKLLIK